MRVEPRLIIKTLIENELKVRKTAKDLGISPATVINWRKKAVCVYDKRKLLTRGLSRKSTKPGSVRITIISAPNQDNITRLRKDTGFCAPKIKGILEIPQHQRTIHRFLKAKGLVAAYGYHRRPLFQNTKHMHAKNVKTLGKLQMDVKYVTPELSGLEHTCYLYAVMDIFSRYKHGIIFPLLDQSYAIEAARLIVPNLPLNPDFIQTDNGLEFQQRFHKFVTGNFSLKHHYIHKGNPNENAVIERSFRTDEEEFFYFRLERMGRPRDILDLNLKYQTYLKEYNNVRPHLSLDLMTPVEKIKSVQ